MNVRKTIYAVSVLALALPGLFGAERSVRAQELVYQDTLHGEIVATGNTLGLDSNLDGTNPPKPGIGGGIGVFVANPLKFASDTLGTWSAGVTSDWRRAGSSAFLDLGETVGIEHAELVWACSSQVNGDPATPIDTPKTATLTLPDGTEMPVTPDGEVTNLTLLRAAYRYYQRWADVTDLVIDGGAGLYTMSDVAGTSKPDANYLTGCGWTLVVVTSATEMPLRNLNVWVAGLEIRATGVNGAGVACPCNLEIELDGFCTPAAPASPSGRMVVSAMEGDVRFVGDTMGIQNPLILDAFLPLAGPNNARNNFFASQINGSDGLLDSRGTFGTSNHTIDPSDGSKFTQLPGARQGWDITRIPLNDATFNPGVLKNDQTATRFKITTTPQGDDYILNAVAMELDVASPLLLSEHQVDREVTFVGDIVTASITLTNGGYASADAVAFCYDVPDNTQLLGVSVDGTARTGVTADSLSPRHCQSPTGGLGLGSMAVGEARTISVRMRVTRIEPKPSQYDRVRVTESWRTEWTPRCAGAQKETDSQIGTTRAIVAPLLRVTLTVTPNTDVDGGTTLTYQIVVQNVGSGPSSGTIVIAGIPVGTTYVSGSTTLNGEQVPDEGGTTAFADGHEVHSDGSDAGVIVPGQAATVTYQVVTDEPTTTDRTEVVNAVDVDPDGPSGPSPTTTSNEVVTGVNGLIPVEPEPEPEAEVVEPEPEPEPQPEVVEVDPCTLTPNNCYLVEGGGCASGGTDVGLAMGILAGALVVMRRRRAA